jgi:hypothetical protein
MRNVLYRKVVREANLHGEDYRDMADSILVTEEANGHGIFFEHCPGGEEQNLYLLFFLSPHNRFGVIEQGVTWGKMPVAEILEYATTCGIKVY